MSTSTPTPTPTSNLTQDPNIAEKTPPPSDKGYIHPVNKNLFSCFPNGIGRHACTFDAFKTVYFDHRFRGDGAKNEVQVEIPWYFRFFKGGYIRWKTGSLGIDWRIGTPSASSIKFQPEWQKLIAEGKCEIKDWWLS